MPLDEYSNPDNLIADFVVALKNSSERKGGPSVIALFEQGRIALINQFPKGSKSIHEHERYALRSWLRPTLFKGAWCMPIQVVDRLLELEHQSSSVLPVAYERSLILYIDLLGVKDAIGRADNTILRQYIDAFTANIPSVFDEDTEKWVQDEEVRFARAHQASPSPARRHLRVFSDNLVISAPCGPFDEPVLGQLLSDAIKLQMKFAMHGFAIRGGIDVGDCYADPNIVIGPALISAYELENRHAIVPRIILSSAVERMLMTHYQYYGFGRHAPAFQQVRVDSDGRFFVNYLLYGFSHTDIADQLRDWTHHKEFILQGLKANEGNPSVRSKYSWMADYHNHFVSTCVPPRMKQGLRIRPSATRNHIESLPYDPRGGPMVIE